MVDLQGRFETGDKPTQADFFALIAAIQEAAQEHEHTPSGGPGTDTGDAAPVKFLHAGLEEHKPASPTPGQVYIATDTLKVYLCFAPESWTVIYGG